MTTELTKAAQQALESIKDLQGYRPDIDSAITALERALTQRPAAQTEREACMHVLYETTDAERPKEICDRNGEVVLAMCKLCGKVEIELEDPQQATPEPVGEVVYIAKGHLREVLNGNTMNAYLSPEPDRFADVALSTHRAPGVPEGFALVKSPITEAMHEAACKVLTRSTGMDGLPQRMLDALAAAQAKGADPEDLAAAGVMLMGLRADHD